jgi:pyruvate/2-oxoglutarate dehydrogenase complex dihydrolipoamide acyltransferase (E2) component
VPSPVAGTLSELVADEGETVEVGAVIARIDENGKAAAGKEAESTPSNPPGAGESPALRKPEDGPEEKPEEEPAPAQEEPAGEPEDARDESPKTANPPTRS